jgi:hypothetical protein
LNTAQGDIVPTTGRAFYFNGGEYYGIFRVSIVDAQNGIVSNGADQLYILECSISYSTHYPAGQALTAVSIVGAETFMEQCLLSFTGSARSGQYGIVIGSSSTGSSYTRVVDTEIDGFYTGIQLATAQGGPTNKGSMFTSVRVLTPSGGIGLNLQPNAYDVRFVACAFENITPGTAQNIVIGPVDGGNESIDTVIFDASTSLGSIDYGLQIAGGQNIQVLGGTYSGNTTAGIGITGAATEIQVNGANCIGILEPGSLNQRSQLYGISINPGSGVIVQDVQLVGVNCSGNGTSENGSGIYINGTGVSDVRIDDAVCEGSVFAIASQQQYGIYVNGASGVTIAASVATGNTSYGIYLTAVTNVTVAISELIRNSTAGISVNGGSGAQSEYVFLRSCNVTGYSPGSAIIFSGTLVVVETSNCAGYNDVGVVVATGFPSGSATYGTAFYPYQLGSTPYYGPIEFYIIAITQSGGFINAIKLSGTATQLTSGAFYVNPRETIEIDGIPPIHFLAIGK